MVKVLLNFRQHLDSPLLTYVVPFACSCQTYFFLTPQPTTWHHCREGRYFQRGSHTNDFLMCLTQQSLGKLASFMQCHFMERAQQISKWTIYYRIPIIQLFFEKSLLLPKNSDVRPDVFHYLTKCFGQNGGFSRNNHVTAKQW